MFQIILSTMFQHFKHLAQLQLNETSQGRVMCSDVGSNSENFLLNQQSESTNWIYKMGLKSTKTESDIHILLEPHTPQNLLDSTVPHFLANWKKSTRVMCIWDIVGGASDTPPVPTNWVQDLITKFTLLLPIYLDLMSHNRWPIKKFPPVLGFSPQIIVFYASMTLYKPPHFEEQCAITSPRCNGKHSLCNWV